MEKNFKTYFRLFTSTFLISAFTFGGGYVIVPLLRKKFVEDLKWIDEKDMLNMVAIAQSAPGPIAVNTSIMIGHRIAGFWGAVLAILGTVLPPFIIISIISLFYTLFKENEIISALLKGMQSGVAAVIIDVSIRMGANELKEKQAISYLIMIGAFVLTFVFKVNVIFIIILCALIGLVSFQMKNKKGGKRACAHKK